MSRPTGERAHQELKSAFITGGVRGALMHLNSLTSHRFTSLFRFDGETLHNVTFYDRKNPGQQRCEEIPVTASYCVFVRDSGSTFSVDDAPNDARVQEHPKREAVQRYCGVPLLDRDGRMFGTICHFDLMPGQISRDEIDLLEFMGALLREQDALNA